jgi:Pyruvate/2-oxoacid:ferredoxin oxidoreductase gamma subunit
LKSVNAAIDETFGKKIAHGNIAAAIAAYESVAGAAAAA